MSSSWHLKKKKLAEEQFERELQNTKDVADSLKDQASASAMGKGDDELFEKKMTKEEKKAAKKAAREAKKKAKGKKGDDDDDDDNNKVNVQEALASAKESMVDGATANIADDGTDFEQADALAQAGTICTFSASKKGVDARSRDINVQNFTL